MKTTDTGWISLDPATDSRVVHTETHRVEATVHADGSVVVDSRRAKVSGGYVARGRIYREKFSTREAARGYAEGWFASE